MNLDRSESLQKMLLQADLLHPNFTDSLLWLHFLPNFDRSQNMILSSIINNKNIFIVCNFKDLWKNLTLYKKACILSAKNIEK